MAQKNTDQVWHPQLSSNNYKIEQEIHAYGDIDFDFFEPGDQLCNVSNPKLPIGKTAKMPIKLIIPTKDIHTYPTDSENDKFSKEKLKMPKSSNLMNCIAYASPNGTVKAKNVGDQHYPPSTDFDSVSSDSTSEITNVTSRATSSEHTMLEQDDNSKFQSSRKQRKKCDENSMESGTQLLDDVNNLEVGECSSDISKTSSSLTSVTSSMGRKNSTVKKNMSFSTSQLREIDRNNMILLQKIQETKITITKSLVPPPSFKLSSSAINRRNLQEKIDLENHKIARRLQTIKSTTDTSSPWMFSRRK